MQTDGYLYCFDISMNECHSSFLIPRREKEVELYGKMFILHASEHYFPSPGMNILHIEAWAEEDYTQDKEFISQVRKEARMYIRPLVTGMVPISMRRFVP